MLWNLGNMYGDNVIICFWKDLDMCIIKGIIIKSNKCVLSINSRFYCVRMCENDNFWCFYYRKQKFLENVLEKFSFKKFLREVK